MRPKIIVFASGKPEGGPSSRRSELRPREGGGSGFENLVEATKTGVLDAEIVAVVSNHEHGGVRERAERLGISFVHFAGPYDAEHYQKVVVDAEAEWAALSGWLKLVKGLDPRKTFNIHPALLSQLDGRFGGKGMYGNRIHEAVKEVFEKGEITESGFTMHFVTDELDRGPAFFERHVSLKKGMSAEEIAKVVNKAEHEWQPKITNLVVHRKVHWDGKDPNSLVVPPDLA